MDTAANILQIYGADLKGAALALIAAALVSLIREQLPDEVLSQPWVSTAWYWFRIGGVVVLIIFVGCLWYRGNNFVLNGSFVDATKHWGNGYYEDLLRNGNWDTQETIQNYKRAMFNFPYVLHMPRPARRAESDPVPNSNGQLDYVAGEWFLNLRRHAFKIEFNDDEGTNRFGTLSQRLHGLKPHRNYRAIFWVRAEEYTPGALRLTAHLNWKPCEIVQIERLNSWEKKTCRFEVGDTEQVDFRFVIQARARLWITGVGVYPD
ncbi:MAG: hypothetical protein A3H45_01200 [Ignavibacteria bacterium RIFCSPLOWO2_02_FULL_55_14]|nr:MAG: hypothetical protein A3H45_01200 [Ignavibacteria bacterium RIFCSPLOWO2_02_FULL_55_14]